jgi:hypothetical protein
VDCEERELPVALLDRADFERARLTLDEYREYADYGDYRCDREGRLMGLVFAGQTARLALVSFAAFQSWCALLRELPTAERLDDFAASVEAFRRGPWVKLRPVFAGYRAKAAVDERSTLSVPVDPVSYRQWLMCLGEDPSPALLDAYASLLVEFWTELPVATADLE